MTFEQISADYKDAITYLSAVEALNLVTVKTVAKKLGMYATWMAKHIHRNQFTGYTLTTNQEDTLELMDSMVTDQHRLRRIIHGQGTEKTGSSTRYG